MESPTSNYCPTDPAATACGSLGSVGAATLLLERAAHYVSTIDTTFALPKNALIDVDHGTFRVQLPDVRASAAAGAGLSASLLVGLVMAFVMHGYLREMKPSPRKLLLGGALFLSAILVPYGIIDLLREPNTAVRFTICLPFALYQFRVLEGLFGFTPAGAVGNFEVYGAYFALPFDMIFEDDRPVMATRREKIESVLGLWRPVAIMILMLSTMIPFDFKPFGEQNAGEYHETISVQDYLAPGHLGNCFAIAIFFQQGLALGDALTGGAIQLFLGYKSERCMRNPMLDSDSPSDFWGRKWNRLVHAVLKRGIYKPFRKHTGSPVVSQLAVFVASGLFHEWLIHACFLYNRPRVDKSRVLLWSNTAFFVWNFGVVMCERLVVGTRLVKFLSGITPQAVVPLVIIMCSLPMAHWFGGPYVYGGFLEDYAKLVPMVIKIR